jgi:hypothetical protein
MLVAGEGVVRDVVSRFGAVNIGIWCQGDISFKRLGEELSPI